MYVYRYDSRMKSEILFIHRDKATKYERFRRGQHSRFSDNLASKKFLTTQNLL